MHEIGEGPYEELERVKRERDEARAQLTVVRKQADDALALHTEAEAELDVAQKRNERLGSFTKDVADEPCAYGDNCPPFGGSRHGTCIHCRARAALLPEKQTEGK